MVAGWLACFFFSILYGLKFTDDQVRPRLQTCEAPVAGVSRNLTVCVNRRAPTQATSWLTSFAISVATSVIVLQSLTALLGGLLATVLSTAVVGSAIAALAVGTEMVSMS